MVSLLDLQLNGWEFDSRPPRLVLGQANLPQYFSRPTQPATVSRMGNEYQPMCGDALRLASKGRYDSFHLWINVWVAGKTV